MRKWYSLIDKVYRLDNLHQAYRSVRSNKGAPGIDGETVEEFGEHLDERLHQIHLELKTNTYQPSPVRRVEIDKDDGSKRPLGIPTVKDRVVQEALRRVIEPIFEPDFHPSSYAYRPGRSCQAAVAKAELFINRYGLKHVVDMDLSKCFDRLDHELILNGVSRRISDGRILDLIRKFLKAGVMRDGSWEETEIGSPQGGVISPLLCNIYLDMFDQKMKALGIRIGAVPKARLGQPRLLSIRRVMERLGVFPKQMTVGSPVISRLWQPTLSDYVLYTAAPIRR